MEPQAEKTNSVVSPPPKPQPLPTTTNKHITSDVPATKPAKHPGRVASGKALAERNRIAKEAKKLQQQQQLQQQANPTPKPELSTNNNGNNGNKVNENNTSGYFILGVCGLLISFLGVYYQREAIMNAIGGK